MSAARFDEILIFVFRLMMGWVFLDSGIWQILDSNFSAAAFLRETKIFHDFFVWFAAPAMIGYTDVLVKWGNLLVGISLFCGLLTRLGGIVAILLLAAYHLVHVDFPYFLTDRHFNFILDYHLVYIAIIVYLIGKRAGHVWGLDRIIEQSPFFKRYPGVRVLMS